MDDRPVGRGRGLTDKGRATRARIVSTAANLIFARGVAGTSIEDVRRAASVSGSQMTHYFRDKRSLIRAVIAWQADQVIEFQTQPRLGRLDSFEALRLWADLNIERQVAVGFRGGCRLGSLASELAESDEQTRADLVAGFERWAAVIREGLAAMRERGELRPEANPDQLTTVLLAAHQGGLLLTRTRREAAPLRDALTAALEYVYSYAAPGVAGSRVGQKPGGSA